MSQRWVQRRRQRRRGDSRTPLRVLVLTAPVGEGHVAAARVLAEEIVRANPMAAVTVRDVLPSLGPGLRWLLNDGYRLQLRVAPWLFGLVYAALRRSRLLRWLSRAGLSLAASRALLRLVRGQPTDVIVSTWPIATLVLGSLRLRGKVRVPVCATITDFAGLELWADKGVDLHLVMHESLVPGVERLAGLGSARAVAPLVSSRFLMPRPVREARAALGLPDGPRIVVVSGGGWGVGDLGGAVRAALELDDVYVVCLAGRDGAAHARLEREFVGEPRVSVLGFVDSMSDLLAAADVLVHSTGGVTCLEALACGCPIVAYGAPPGHAPSLAREMAALGLVAHARSVAELPAVLAGAERKRAVTLARGADAASLVLTAVPRVVVRLRARVARSAATAATLAAMLFALFASDMTYPVVAEAFALPETTSLSPAEQSVALIVRGRRGDVLAFAWLARRDRLHASVVASNPLGDKDVAVLRAAGLDPIPALQTGGVGSWFGARDQLRGQTTRYGLHGRFYYLAPHEGFTIGDYLLARELGGRPLQAGCDLARWDGDRCSLRAGEVVVATLRPGVARDRLRLLASVRRIEDSGLGVASVQRLTGAAGHSS